MRDKIILTVILLLALSLRVYKVTEYPAGLNADEAAIGYNAYSLLQTGKDEFGHSWPINFQSFNDYKPGLYFYLALPLVKLFGLNELVVRLPSVILGSLTIFLVFFLVKELFNNELIEVPFSRSAYLNPLPVCTALLLAICPWHLHFSRGGWESNVAVFLIVLGVFFFFIALKKPKFFPLSILSFTFSMLTYHSARIITPLLGIGLLIFYHQQIFSPKNLRWLFTAFLTGIIPFGLLLYSFFGQEGTARFSGVGIFSDQGPFWRVNELRGQHANPYSWFPKLVHNKYLEYGVRFFDNYLRHFNGDFLFISGDEIQRNKVPEMGQLYLIEIPFLVLGFYFLFKNKPQNWQFLIWWLAIAPIASALTFQSPHAIRALNMVIPLVIITSYGLWNILRLNCLNKSIVSLFHCFIVLVFIWNVAFYLHQYYVHYPKTYPAAWEYGFKELAEYVKNNEKRFDRIYVTNKYDQPYVLFAFYLKYPPEKFQEEARLTPKDRFGFSTVDHFGKYYFGSINLEKLTGEGQIMVVGVPDEIPDSATIVKRIYFKEGKKEAFRIIEQ